MGVGQADGYNHVTHTHVEFGNHQAGEVKLLQRHFTTLFKLLFVLSVFGTAAGFHLIFRADAAGLELHFDAKHPLRVELIVASQHHARNRNLVVTDARIAMRRSPAVLAVVLERGYHFAVATHAIPFPAAILQFRHWLLRRGCRCQQQSRQQEV